MPTECSSEYFDFDFLRRMPGLVSETYLRPADSAASFGSTIVCTSAADSNKALPFPPRPRTKCTRGSSIRLTTVGPRWHRMRVRPSAPASSAAG
jgi:hypothetical protein